MGLRVRELAAADVATLREPCASCMFWEIGTASRGAGGGQSATAKVAWWTAQELERPTASRAAWSGGEMVGWALAGDAAALPRTRRMPTEPSEDALVLAALWVEPDVRLHGVARALVQSVLREAARQHRRAVEAYGDPSAVQSCSIPVDVLEALGFEIVAPHPATPRMRLDLRATATWTETATAALERLLSSLARRERRVTVPARDGPAAAARQPQRRPAD